jgi:anti-anti-sigma factor
MEFHTTIIGKEYNIRLEGTADNRDCQRIVDLTRQFIASACDTMVFDLGKLSLLDSLGVSVILLARNELTGNKEKNFILRRPLGKVRHMFQVFNIEKLVKVEW